MPTQKENRSWISLPVCVSLIIILEVCVGPSACQTPKARQVRLHKQIFASSSKYLSWQSGRYSKQRFNRKRSLRHYYERAKRLRYDVSRTTMKPHQNEPPRSATFNTSPTKTLIEDTLALWNLRQRLTLRSKLLDRQIERQWWGIWSTWSACGRTCGSGVQFQERHCLGSRHVSTGMSDTTACEGPGKRYRICNTESCPASTISFRKLQCLQYATESIRGSYYTWKPYGHPADEVVSNKPCQLVCVSNNNEIQISKIAMDGTECHKGWDPGRCVEGKCQLIGCDGKINSGKLRDRCGRCDDHSMPCIITDEVFSKAFISAGEYDVVTIPIGAYDILINERRRTSLSIVVKDTQSNLLFDARGESTSRAIGAEGWPSNFIIAGAVFRYRRPLLQSSESSFEYLLSEGPIKEPIIVCLRAEQRTVGTVHYEFKISTDGPQSTPDGSDLVEGMSNSLIPTSATMQPSSPGIAVLRPTNRTIVHTWNAQVVSSLEKGENTTFTGTTPPPNLPKNVRGSMAEKRAPESGITTTEMPMNGMAATNVDHNAASWLLEEDLSTVPDSHEEASTGTTVQANENSEDPVVIPGTRSGDETEPQKIVVSVVSSPPHLVEIPSLMVLHDEDRSTHANETREEFFFIREVVQREPTSGPRHPQAHTNLNESDREDGDETPSGASPLIHHRSLKRILRLESTNETDLVAQISVLERLLPHRNETYHSMITGGEGDIPTYGGEDESFVPIVNPYTPPEHDENHGKQYSSLVSPLYGWTTNGYAPCSSTCTVGLQDSYAICQRRSDKLKVDDSYCNPATRPEPVRHSCINKQCEPRWEATPWSECSLSCGMGIQMRTIRCWRMIGPGFDSTLYTEGCGHISDKKPKETIPCKVLDTCGPLWETSDWSDCPAPCGKVGIKWRTVRCSAGQDSMCASSPMPITEEECMGPPCLLTWIVTDWGVCFGVCGGGRKSRRVICADIDGNSQPEDLCDPATKPATSHPCGDENCRPEWIVQDWGMCSVECGEGTRMRKVMCAAIVNGKVHQYEDTPCSGTQKPVTQETCNMRTCDPVWFTTSWSKCSVTCGNGHRVREVKCYLADVPADGCNPRQRPLDREVCKMPACPQPRHDKCRDKRTVNCTLVMRVRLCTHWYYRKACCGSCVSKESG